MSETLIIRNFGPIKHVEIELKKFNVIIGENATGKSTIAKVLAVCRYFSYIIPDGKYSPLQESQFSKGLESWGLDQFVKNDSCISYTCKHYSLIAKNTFVTEKDRVYNQESDEPEEIEYTGYVFIPELTGLSSEFNDLLSTLEKLKPKPSEFYGLDFDSLDWTIPSYFYTNDVAKVMDNPFYVPTERGLQSIFSLGKTSISNLTDSLFNQFAALDQIIRRFTSETKIEPLGLFYKNVNGKGVFKVDEGAEYFDLDRGASGYQSTIPVVLLIKYYVEFRKKNKTFLIEEPELNLFPSAQQKLVNYFVANAVNLGGMLLLTTHSPYILTSLNNLMYAYEVGKKEPEEANRIIEKKYWINPQEVSAYMLLKDGTCENIIQSDEDGILIKAEKIDEVSGQLNSEFDKLISLELINA